MAIAPSKPMTSSDFDKINQQITAKEKQAEALQNEIIELKDKARTYVTDLMKRYGIENNGSKTKKSAVVNNAAAVKAEISNYMKNRKGVTSKDLGEYLKAKLGIKRFLAHHYSDTIKVGKDGAVTLVA